MSSHLIKKAENKFLKRVPQLKVGQTVRVHQKIKEGNKERIQIFEGLVIKISSGHGVSKTFTVRKVFQGIGVEKIFPIHSPNIEKIEVTKSSKIRRAKLYYMRERTGKAARLKEKMLSAKDLEDLMIDVPVEEEAEVAAPAPEAQAEETQAPEATPAAAEEKAAATPEKPASEAPAKEEKAAE